MAAVFAKFCGFTATAFVALKSLQILSNRDHLLAKEIQENLELVHVQVAFRHGARTPIFQLPPMQAFQHESVIWDRNILLGDVEHSLVMFKVKSMDGGERPKSKYDTKQQELIWPGGSEAGVLTRIGQQQMYDLGRRLKQRYIQDKDFLSNIMDSNEVFVRTSNIERTVVSARCVLAGLYGQQCIKGAVTMVTNPENTETIYPNIGHCAVLTNWVRNAYKTTTLTTNDYKKNRMILMTDLGINAEKFSFVHIRDYMAAQKAHNMKLSPVVAKHEDMIEKHALEEILLVQCGYPHDRYKELLSLGVGKLLEDFVKRMENKMNQKSATQNKLCLYSAHDTTLVCLIAALGLEIHKWVDFAADLSFELYKNKNDEYFVRILLQGQEQILPGAESPMCPFDSFYKLVSEYFVDDWQKECSRSQ